MINFDLIQANIYVGSSPYSRDDVAGLKQLKISAIISLQSDADLAVRSIDWAELQGWYEDHDIAVHRFPIADFDEHDMAGRLVDPIVALKRLLDDGHRVYTHCNSGICRAPAVVLGYLCHYEGMTIEAGLRQIRISRPIASPFKDAVTAALAQMGMSG